MLHEKINVHIVRSDSLSTAGLRAILSQQAELNVTMHASDPHGMETAHIVVTDIENGMAIAASAARRIARCAPRLMIVAPYAREWEVRRAVDAGVHGYLLESANADELVQATRLLRHGMRYLTAAATHCMVTSLRQVSLTVRENDVLRLLAQGCSNKLIACKLGIGIGTVKTHVKSLMGKLDATARTHAVVLAAERGLIGAGTATAASTWEELAHSMA
jgi:DNA-binding NarL/FixJ family response regulator